MNYEGKSIVVGRKPRIEGNEFKTAFVNIYGTNSPLTTEEFPLHELDFPNIEKVVFTQAVSYYLEGNDIIIEDITSVDIDVSQTTVTIKPNR